MCNEKQNTTNIRVYIEDTVLTPSTCSCLVNEILKCLLYQKSQIPYPYNWLRCAINKARTNPNPVKSNFTIAKHYQTASKIYDSLQETMKNIQIELAEATVDEILIVFGTFVCTPKEIFTIKVPRLARGHDEGRHQQMIQKHQQKILRDIFVSEEWLRAMETTIPCTNTHLLIRKDGKSPTDFFTSANFSVPPNVPNTVIDLSHLNDKADCCGDLKIFVDEAGFEEFADEFVSGPDSGEFRWFQGKGSMKGFKDCFLNKTSASELW